MNKWLAVGGYALVGVLFAAMPIFLADGFTRPSAIVQVAAGGLLAVLAVAIAVDLDPLADGLGGRVLGAVGVVCGLAGTAGLFVL
ncbi:hypothetical protein [Halovenus sp. HT40]|uniref:hypothetical protein n=1 Tax=Halovenus sp. HT40 TaxID=3126691 RepID=UPI00300F2218